METAKYIDKVHEITDALERKAEQRRNTEVQKSNSYKEGYDQACEDFAKWLRCELPGWLEQARKEG